MNATAKNWFMLAFWLGMTYAILFMFVQLTGFDDDTSRPFGQAALIFLSVVLIGEIADFCIKRWKKALK